MIDQTGRVYGGRYRVERSIASGGMAEVFEAHDELLQRTVAIKLMHPEFARDTTFINRFRREAQAAASLNDPRVVAIYDWGSDEGAYYIVMEYVEGSTLREVIETEGPLTPERAVQVAGDICAGLGLAHSKGIIHRDMKSSNVAVTHSGQTKIMDFGIARAASAGEGGQTMTQTGTIIGTANYFSPEQAQGLAVDQRSDLYSVGVILYEMLTRELPFKGDTAVAIAYKHVQENPAPPSYLNRDVPTAVDQVVMKALAKNPDNRYQSAEEMRMDLSRLLEGRPVEATPILPPDQTAVISSADRTSIMPSAPTTIPDNRKTLVYVLAFIVAAGVLAAAGFFLFSLFGGAGPTVVVPDVTGKAQEDAQRVLDARGLRARIERRDFSDSVQEGHVISQSPEEGTKAPTNAAVDLVVSRGPETVEVPSVIGKTRQEAETLLTQAGLVLGSVSDRSDENVEAGKTLGQNPNPGQKVDRGSAVDVVVSKGKAVVRVPEVTGSGVEEAKKRLTDAGLIPAIKNVCDTSQESDKVLDQDPPARQEVQKGATVTLTVNGAAPVPPVVGQTQDQATQTLQGQGYRVKVETAPSLNQGRVISQDPGAGGRGCDGDRVTITVGALLGGTSSPSPSPSASPSFIL